MAIAAKVAHILVVDDEPLTASGLTQYLMLQGYQARAANSVREALRSIERNMPDIILLDLVMPEEGGLELLAELRQDRDTQTLPVIVTSALKDTEDIVGALRAGANDYVTKPVDLPILLARVERHLALSEAMAGLERQNEIQWDLSEKDDPSGAGNCRHLHQTLESEMHRSSRHNTPLSVLVILLDKFSPVSGELGAAAADSLLRQFVESMAGALRRSDKLCRIDTHAFCAVLPQTDAPGALRAAEQIRTWMEQISFSYDSTEIATTVSIGAATYSPDLKGGPEALIDNATRAMQEARRQGSNRVYIYSGNGTPKPAEGIGVK